MPSKRTDLDETRTPVSHCPHCGKRFDAATSTTGKHKPKEGDVSICISCGGILIIKKDLTVRRATKEEHQKVSLDPLVMKVQLFVRGMKRPKDV